MIYARFEIHHKKRAVPLTWFCWTGCSVPHLEESKAMKRLLSAITCLTLLCSACSSGPHTGEPQGDPTAGKDLNYSKFSDVKATFDNEHMEIILPLNKYMMSTPEGLITLSANIYNNNDCSVARGVPSGSTGDGVEIKPYFQYGFGIKTTSPKYGYSIDHDVTKNSYSYITFPHKEIFGKAPDGKY